MVPTVAVVGAGGATFATATSIVVGAVVVEQASARCELVTFAGCGVTVVPRLAVTGTQAVGSTALVVANESSPTVVVGCTGGGGVAHTFAALAFKAEATIAIVHAGTQAASGLASKATKAVVVVGAGPWG